MRIIVKFRGYRHRVLRPIGVFLLPASITPNVMTSISLLCGLLSVYFLFQQYIFFLLFGILHLLADMLDGTIASIAGKTHFGTYFDYAADNIVALLIIIKIGYFLQDYYAYLVAGLYLLAQLFYLYSKLQAPILFGRSVAMITLFFYLPAILAITAYLPQLVYLFAGVISMYSLASQLQWVLRRKFN